MDTHWRETMKWIKWLREWLGLKRELKSLKRKVARLGGQEEKPSNLPSFDAEGYWRQETYLAYVEKAITALEIAKRPVLPGTVISARVSQKEWDRIRQFGIYFPSGKGLIKFGEIDGEFQQRGSMGFFVDLKKDNPDKMPSTINMAYAERAPLPKSVRRTHAGIPYYGVRITLDERDRLILCKEWATIDPHTKEPHNVITTINDYGERFVGTTREVPSNYNLVPVILNTYAQRKDGWIVEASANGRWRCHFGVYEEQIQSLLYSRTQPLTGAGKRRPILHWVEAHQRRMKNGTTVDIPKHLRGVNKFLMGDMQFSITEPIKPTRIYAG
jgi:hypothetical protein